MMQQQQQHKTCSKLCRLCGKEKQRGTDVFKDKVKGAVLCSIISKYFPKEVIDIGITDTFTKYVCMECEQKICTFDEFCLMVANVQKQLAAPSLEIDFAEDMLCHLKEHEISLEKSSKQVGALCRGRRQRQRHICQVCGKEFRCQAHLERHKIIHTGERPFTCGICSMSFNQREVLKKHEETHQRGRKEFRCANCHQSFRLKVSLKSHMINFHTPAELENCRSSEQQQQQHRQQQQQGIDRSLSCNECGKLFATRYKLERHSRCHTGEKPFMCNYCNRSFSQTGNLKLHETKCHNRGGIVSLCQMATRVEHATTNLEPIPSTSHNSNNNNNNNNPNNCEYVEQSARGGGGVLSSCSSIVVVGPPPPPIVANSDIARRNDVHTSSSLINYQSIFITESEMEETLNETIHSNLNNSTSYLMKNYENDPIYIDNEIESMLDRDLANLDSSNKFSSSSGNEDVIVQNKTILPMSLKQPETPELLHSLLYDD